MANNTALAVAVEDSSQVGEARRAAAALGLELGMTEVERGQLALVVTEAGNNLVRHAGGGRIVLQPVALGDAETQWRWMDVFALDTGPGIRNIASALRDGHSTAGTAGQGLGAILRSSSVFDIFSAPDKGTALFSRIAMVASNKPASTPFDWGVISLPYPGETVCGDAWSIETRSNGMAWFLIADGLGHGAGASEASTEAARLFHSEQTRLMPARALETMHAGLRHTRGAAAAIASLEAESVVFAGVGNIQAALITSEGMHGMASFNGTVGHQAHKFADMPYPFSCETLLVMASDGLTTQWRLDSYPGIFSRHPALIAALLLRDFCRGRDDATVLVARLGEPASEAKSQETL